MFRKIILLNFVIVVLADRDNNVHSIPLNSETTFHWGLDFSRELLRVELHFFGNANSWFAVGFSNYGDLKSADYCIFWTDWHREVRLEDSWIDDNGFITYDRQQDCRDFRWSRHNNLTKFTFSRKFDTCDDKDYVIERGTTHVVWLKGQGPLSSLTGLGLTDAQTSGMSRTELLRIPHKKPKFPKDSWKLALTNHRVQVPSSETTYWCKIKKLPPTLTEKHHILQFGSVIEPGNEHLVHHMEVFHCAGPIDLEIPLYDGPCTGPDRPEKTQICKQVLAAWAMGADDFIYPEQAGLSIGGTNFNPYVMLEVHYNNPQLETARLDSSGIAFVLTKELREYDAGVIELGLEYTDKMAIPPNQESFALTGHCITECTGVGLPENGIHVFASQLHTHLTGTKVITRHVRDGQELSPLNYDNHYSTHFQEIRLLPETRIILPGDSLITTCTYNTLDRANVTLGGFAISDEMCVNYIHYYPKARLEVCKSAISDDALHTYFRYLNEWENQKTNADQGISKNYQNVQWNRVRVMALHDLYLAAPLGMQCNGSDGTRLPGLWNNIAATPVKLPHPPRPRDCEKHE